MLCPRCNSDMRVIETADASTPGLNLRFRDWRCKEPTCRFVFRSVEMEDSGRGKSARWYVRALLSGRDKLPNLPS